MSTTRQRRSRAVKSTTKESSKQTKKSDSTSKKMKKKEKKTLTIADENPECGFETVANKRRSKRLRVKKQKKEQDSDYDSDSDSDSDQSKESNKKNKTNKTNKSNKKRKRNDNDNENDVKSPPKKKARKTLKKKKDILGEWVRDPSFVSDRDLLLRIGIGYTKNKNDNNNNNKNKKRLPKLYYKTTKKYENKIYKWHNNRKYRLLAVLGHRLEKDIGVVFKEFEPDRMWYDSINYSPIKRMLDDETDTSNNNNSNNSNNAATPISENNEIVLPMNGNNEIKNSEEDDADDNDNDNNNNNNNNNGQEAEEDRPQVNFGKLLLKCKWEDDWPDETEETWDTICDTGVFKQYCIDKEWVVADQNDQLQATVMAHNDDEFKKIVNNIRLFASPTTRKALKMIINKELNVW